MLYEDIKEAKLMMNHAIPDVTVNNGACYRCYPVGCTLVTVTCETLCHHTATGLEQILALQEITTGSKDVYR